MNFGKLANRKKKEIADEVFDWYEKTYQIEIPDQEKQEFEVSWTMKILTGYKILFVKYRGVPNMTASK